MAIDVFFYGEPGGQFGNGQAAKKICAECPVIHECLTDALSIPHRDQYGVSGGKTALERQRILETRLLRRRT
jgi:hypothetical protein